MHMCAERWLFVALVVVLVLSAHCAHGEETWNRLPTVAGASLNSNRVSVTAVEIPLERSLLIHGGVDVDVPDLWYDDTYILKSDNESISWLYAPSNYQKRPPKQGAGASMVWNAAMSSAFLYGGWTRTQAYANCATCDCCHLSPSVWQLDYANSMWTLLEPSDPPPARTGHVAVNDELNSRMIVFGGMNELSQILNDMWELDLSNISQPTWEKISPEGPAPSPRYGHAGILYSDKLYIFGGTNGTYVFPDLYVFDFDTAMWTLLTYTADVNVQARHSFTSFHRDNNREWIIFGGQSSTTLECPVCLDVLDLDSLSISREIIVPGIVDPPAVPAPVALRQPYGLWLYTGDGIFQYKDGGYCGDGALAVYEDCDDANSIPLDGCNDCVREYCGDLIVNNNGTETCDGGDDCPLTCICNSTISEADPETPGACRPLCGNEAFDADKEICDAGPMCLETCECPITFIADGSGGCRAPYDARNIYIGYLLSLGIFIAFASFLAVFIYKCRTNRTKFRIV